LSRHVPLADDIGSSDEDHDWSGWMSGSVAPAAQPREDDGLMGMLAPFGRASRRFLDVVQFSGVIRPYGLTA